jgi:hypothetical protein
MIGYGLALWTRRVSAQRTRVSIMTSKRLLAWIVVVAAVPLSLAACGDDDASKQTFVQVGQVQQWIVNHECSRTGAVKGYPGYGGVGGGQIAQETFVCDNGKTFVINLKTDGTYTYIKQ